MPTKHLRRAGIWPHQQCGNTSGVVGVFRMRLLVDFNLMAEEHLQNESSKAEQIEEEAN
jgi:hypothetical protein